MGATAEVVRTDEMGLVAYLRYHGFLPHRIEFMAGTCNWTFVDDGRGEVTLQTLARTYRAGEGLVEPQRYNRAYQTTKHEFYDANPQDPGRRRA